MLPSYHLIPALQSGSFFELRDNNDFRAQDMNQISIFLSNEGRFYRDMAMPLNLASVVIGCATRPNMNEGAISAVAVKILETINQRSCSGGACTIDLADSQIVNRSFLRVSGRAVNTGETPWAGWGVCSDFYDSIGMRCLSQSGELVSEHRIAMPYECIPPGGSLLFEEVFPLHRLVGSPGDFVLDFDLVREGISWYTPVEKRPRLQVEVPFLPPEIELEVAQIPSAVDKIALTFDGGSSATCCAELLEVLRRYQIRSTIFLTGTFIRRFPEAVQTMVRDGHEIANHTLTHSRLCFDRDSKVCAGISREFLQTELSETSDLYHSLTGQSMAPLWRAPFGHRNSLLLLWGEEVGYRHIFWDYDSEDWRVGVGRGPTLSAEQAGTRCLKFLRGESGGKGNILLFHLASGNSADPFYPWIERLITECLKRSITMTTVSALLAEV